MCKFPFSKSSRLLKRREFARVSRAGFRRSGKWIFVEILPKPEQSSTRLGITVTKKFGKAHERNRFKRLVRESFRLIMPFQTMSTYDLVVRPKGKHPLLKEALSLVQVKTDLEDILRAVCK